jgi:hypothetical protein
MPENIMTSSSVVSTDRLPEQNQLINLPSGGDLTPDTGCEITAASLTRLVVLAGEAESGKTTLLTAIYEKFNEGEFADLLFAGSITLVGWEKRCHLSRITSGSEKADTERTLGLKKRLLHLKVRDKSLAGPPQDVLFADLSGEVFKLIRDSTDECQRLEMLKRADHFVLLIDGDKLSRIANRHEAQNNSAALLRSCVDAGMVGKNSFVDVVFSKCDLLAKADSGTSDFLKSCKEMIQNRFGTRVGRLRFHQIAARPESGDFEFAHGISGLLRDWVKDSPVFHRSLSLAAHIRPEASMFEKYLFVRFPNFTEIRLWK